MDSVEYLCGREPRCGEWGASSAVLKVTVTRSEATVLDLLKGNYIIIFVERCGARIIREFNLMEEIR